MASEGEGISEPISGLAIAESIRKIAAGNARAPIDNEEQLTLFLKSWWSRTYNRPLLDPLLQTYTLDQLLYEYYDRIERHAAEQEAVSNEETKKEEDRDKEAQDWADKMEQEELSAAAAAAQGTQPANAEVQPAGDPTKDPANVKWMEEQIQMHKQQFGPTFGEDIQEDFE
jgi:hypothetical protein